MSVSTKHIAANDPSGWVRGLRLLSVKRISAVYLMAVIVVLFGIWVPATFLSVTTFQLVAEDQVVIGMVAIALLIPFIGGEFDLSVGAMVAFSLVIVSWFGQHTHVNVVLACFVALVACGIVGWLSGLIVIYFGVNSFIATLGMSQVLSAISLYLSANSQIVGVLPPRFLRFGNAVYHGVPVVAIYLAGLALIVWYVVEFTALGRRLIATGVNAEASRLAGIRTERMKWGTFVISALIAGLAGIVYGAQVGSYSNTFGQPLLFPAFAAVFFGATQIKSRPNVWGTVIALYALALGVKGLQLALTQTGYWMTPLFNGVALLIAVAASVRGGRISLHRLKMRRQRPEAGGPTEVHDEPVIVEAAR
jgi:ribose transport system permease protein